MRIHTQEITPGCGEWVSVLFSKFGTRLWSERGLTEQEAAHKLEETIQDALCVKFGCRADQLEYWCS